MKIYFEISTHRTDYYKDVKMSNVKMYSNLPGSEANVRIYGIWSNEVAFNNRHVTKYWIDTDIYNQKFSNYYAKILEEAIIMLRNDKLDAILDGR